MFKPGDRVRRPSLERVIASIGDYGEPGWLTFTDKSNGWECDFELVEPAITVTHLRDMCYQLRSVAGPQGRFWIREVFEKATGERME